MHAYYDLFKSVYDKHEFDSHPETIYNMDETGVPLEPQPPIVVAEKGQKSQITVIGCASTIIPPYIILAAKQLNEQWTRNEADHNTQSVTKDGWTRSFSFIG